MPKKNFSIPAKTKSKKKGNSKTARAASNQKVKVQARKLPSVIKLTKDSFMVLWPNRLVLLVIVLIYGLAYLFFVLGLTSPGNINSFKSEFSGVFHGHFSSLYSGFGIFSYLLGSTTNSSSPSGSAYQIFILIIASLSIIWSLRQFYQGRKIRARDSYYQGLYPFIPYILVILFIALELLPLIIGLALYTLLFNGSIAITGLEKALSLLIIIPLIGWSIYLVSSSIIAQYIVALPDMTPMRALRSAKALVKGRRWLVLRKMAFLPLLLFISIGIVMLPIILILPAISPWIFFGLTLLALAYAHSYLYSLYRGLINE